MYKLFIFNSKFENLLTVGLSQNGSQLKIITVQNRTLFYCCMYSTTFGYSAIAVK